METILNIEYLTNKYGDAIAVVIPMDIWRQLLPDESEDCRMGVRK